MLAEYLGEPFFWKEGESGTLSTPRGKLVGAVAFLSSGFYLCCGVRTTLHYPAGRQAGRQAAIDRDRATVYCGRAELLEGAGHCRVRDRRALKVGGPTPTPSPSPTPPQRGKFTV